jgi:hypothetical protein
MPVSGVTTKAAADGSTDFWAAALEIGSCVATAARIPRYHVNVIHIFRKLRSV